MLRRFGSVKNFCVDFCQNFCFPSVGEDGTVTPPPMPPSGGSFSNSFSSSFSGGV